MSEIIINPPHAYFEWVKVFDILKTVVLWFCFCGDKENAKGDKGENFRKNSI